MKTESDIEYNNKSKPITLLPYNCIDVTVLSSLTPERKDALWYSYDKFINNSWKPNFNNVDNISLQEFFGDFNGRLHKR